MNRDSWPLRRLALTAGLLSASLLTLDLDLGIDSVRAAEPPPAKPGTTPIPSPPTEPELLAVGSPAPPFSAVGHDGQKIDLGKLRGKNIVLYFYPRDDTPGCTKEACDIRDAWERLSKAGIAVFGVSTDSNDSHKKFADKHKLPFTLLPDEQGEIAKKYRVPVVSGKARRITYLIGKDGNIKYVWPKVTPVGHAAEILAQVEAK